MEKNTYNGWTNYETWLVNLWLTNDEGSDEMARECCKAGREYESGKALREMVEEWNPCQESGLFADLVGAALSAVNWQEIAEHYTEDMEEEEEEAI